MSKKQGLFDAAIEVLEDIALTTNLCRHIPGYKNRTKLIRAAIPVLEAAGKVDKGALLTLGANAVCIADYYCQGDELKELEARFKRGEADLKIIIEALPEKEEK